MCRRARVLDDSPVRSLDLAIGLLSAAVDHMNVPLVATRRLIP